MPHSHSYVTAVISRTNKEAETAKVKMLGARAKLKQVRSGGMQHVQDRQDRHRLCFILRLIWPRCVQQESCRLILSFPRHSLRLRLYIAPSCDSLLYCSC